MLVLHSNIRFLTPFKGGASQHNSMPVPSSNKWGVKCINCIDCFFILDCIQESTEFYTIVILITHQDRKTLRRIAGYD